MDGRFLNSTEELQVYCFPASTYLVMLAGENNCFPFSRRLLTCLKVCH